MKKTLLVVLLLVIVSFALFAADFKTYADARWAAFEQYKDIPVERIVNERHPDGDWAVACFYAESFALARMSEIAASFNDTDNAAKFLDEAKDIEKRFMTFANMRIGKNLTTKDKLDAAIKRAMKVCGLEAMYDGKGGTQ